MNQLFFVIVCLVLVGLLAALFNKFRMQRAAMNRVMHLLSNLAQGQYARRTDPLFTGMAGELAKTANELAGNLDTRGQQAQQDKDHLVSLLAVLDHTNEIAIATDNMDVIRLVSPAGARVLDQPVEQLLGKHIERVIHHPDLMGLYKTAFTSTKPVSAPVALQMPGRTVHCQATAATIYNGPHYRGTLLLMRDITEVARTLQMKTDFVSNASHELRTPLASIRAAVETLREDIDHDPESSRRCIDIINNHTLRLQLLVQDLLDLSRTEDSRAVVRHDRVNLELVAEMIVGMHSGAASDKGVRLEVELAPDAQTMRGDERLLTLMLKNLVDNALKFTAQGRVTIRSLMEGENFVLLVEDTGIGIPPEDQERVFERFYTVNRSRGGADRGTGLGLAIVKHAVAAMGGHVELQSQLHKGTTMRCVFPVAVPAA